MSKFNEMALGNELLCALPSTVVENIREKLQPVELKAGDTLYTAGSHLRHAYFPVTAVVSLFSPLKEGSGAEVAAVGKEGIVGVCTFMGGGDAMSSAVVQRSGLAYRVSTDAITELAHDEHVMQHLLRYSQMLFTNMAKTSACHSNHTLYEQLSSWLLQHLDLQESDDIYITQERISGMLGVRRESITESALRLQKKGLISYQRGLIKVLDRGELEHQCCECYGEIREAFAHLREETEQVQSLSS